MVGTSHTHVGAYKKQRDAPGWAQGLAASSAGALRAQLSRQSHMLTCCGPAGLLPRPGLEIPPVPEERQLRPGNAPAKARLGGKGSFGCLQRRREGNRDSCSCALPVWPPGPLLPRGWSQDGGATRVPKPECRRKPPGAPRGSRDMRGQPQGSSGTSEGARTPLPVREQEGPREPSPLRAPPLRLLRAGLARRGSRRWLWPGHGGWTAAARGLSLPHTGTADGTGKCGGAPVQKWEV